MDAQSLITVESNTKVEDFVPGDTVRVSFRVREAERERVQVFQGVVIRTRQGGQASSFTVRRVASGVGVERSFFYHSPNVDSVEVIRRGIVRRNNLTYLRGLSGKNARIKERTQSGKR